MSSKKSILICVDHAGYSGMKMLCAQFKRVGVETDMILFAWLKSNECFDILLPETKSEAQKNLIGFYQNFCDQNELDGRSISKEHFLNLIFQIKNDPVFEWDPAGWHLLGDLNLGSPGLPHITPLFDQIVRLCAAKPCGTLFLFPYSQISEGCQVANQYMAGQMTAAYENFRGERCNGFVLNLSVWGFAANKNDMAGWLEENWLDYQASREASTGSALTPINKPEHILLPDETEVNVATQKASPMVGSTRESVQSRPWYMIGLCCFFSLNRRSIPKVATASDDSYQGLDEGMSVET